MAEIVCGIQMPKQAMESLLSDSTCPTLKVGERAYCMLLFLNQIPYFKARVVFLAHFSQQAPICLSRTQT